MLRQPDIPPSGDRDGALHNVTSRNRHRKMQSKSHDHMHYGLDYLTALLQWLCRHGQPPSWVLRKGSGVSYLTQLQLPSESCPDKTLSLA